MDKTTLGDRMKLYERVTKRYLPMNSYYVIRIDGKAFHTFTKHCDRPFDNYLTDTFICVAEYLVNNIQGAKYAYHQSDEISVFCDDLDSNETQHWFGGNISKIETLSASMATAVFNPLYEKSDIQALFDSRVILLPNKSEVDNYLIWRQRDWNRNSIQMLARKYYSHKECHGKNHSELHEMIHQAGDNWANLPDRYKNGTIVRRGD